MKDKTHWKKMTDTNYLGSWDVDDSLDVVIKKIVKEKFYTPGEGESEGVVAYFDSIEKGMILNKTNLKAIENALNSPFVEDWAGQKITLKVAQVRAFGETVDALRVHRYNKSVLNTERFNKSLAMIKEGKYKKEELIKNFELSNTQLKQLENVK